METNVMDRLEIVEYQEDYQKDYKSLSYEWLEKYRLIEPEDKRILDHPKETVLDGGGHIFFAKRYDLIIGTATLIRTDDHTFELAKLSVTEGYQGRKIGSRLIETCIQTAKNGGADRLILYTNHILKPAIHLYGKYGFRIIPQDVQKYIEGDIEMELNLLSCSLKGGRSVEE